jgi:hypothetical protein
LQCSLSSSAQTLDGKTPEEPAVNLVASSSDQASFRSRKGNIRSPGILRKVDIKSSPIHLLAYNSSTQCRELRDLCILALTAL